MSTHLPAVSIAAGREDDAVWERAIAAASTPSSKTLTLDGAVKSATNHLPSPAVLARVAASLEELSVAGARLSSLAGGLPRLPALRRLSLPDNRLSGAAALAEACGATLRYLDLGNNRFAEVEELAPLAKLGVEVLDLFQCPLTKVNGYREKVFKLIPSVKYLDGVDAEGNERLGTDEEEDDDDEGEEGDEEGEGGEEEEGDEEDGEGDEEDGEGDEDDEEEEGDEEVQDEEDEAKENEPCADADDKENNGTKAESSQPSKRKREDEDDTNAKK